MTTYWDYIRVDDLLSLQGGTGKDDRTLSRHEVLFVVVHQVFELWFKVVLRELEALQGVFRKDPVPEPDMAEAARSLERVLTVLRVAAQHWEVVETLHTRDYLDFRDRLFPASGFQSAQMREIEAVLGLDDAERVGFAKDSQYLAALEARAKERLASRRSEAPTLRDAVDAWLHRTPIRGSRPGDAGDAETVRSFAKDYLARLDGTIQARIDALAHEVPDAAARTAIGGRYRQEADAARAWLLDKDPRRLRIRAAILFIQSYRDLPLLAWPQRVLNLLVEVEQAFVVFRQRHARMVERVIGRRVGTGGTGLDYLEETARYRVFKDLWAARTFLVRRDALPPLSDPTPYEFRM